MAIDLAIEGEALIDDSSGVPVTADIGIFGGVTIPVGTVPERGYLRTRTTGGRWLSPLPVTSTESLCQRQTHPRNLAPSCQRCGLRSLMKNVRNASERRLDARVLGPAAAKA